MAPNPQSKDKPISKGDDELDEQFRQSYFKQLVGQFETVGDEVKDDEARTLGKKIVAKAAEEIEWEDIYQLELVIVRLEPELRSRRRAGMLRAELKSVIPNEYQEYVLSKPPDAEKDPIASVRADSVRIQEELNWYYTVLWVQEAFRTSLLKRVAKRTALYLASYLVLGLLLLGLWIFSGVLNLFGNEKVPADEITRDGAALTNSLPASTNIASARGEGGAGGSASAVMRERGMTNAAVAWSKLTRTERARWKTEQALPVLTTYWLVIIAGTVGALVSILRRIQAMSLDGNSDVNLVQLEQSSSSIDYSPLLGAVFALLLLFMFMSGLLSGALFPKAEEGHARVFLGCVPSSCVEVAKLLVWSFIAGFAEKFVPDALDKLQTRADSGEKPSASK